jgi:hypothetical protein
MRVSLAFVAVVGLLQGALPSSGAAKQDKESIKRFGVPAAVLNEPEDYKAKLQSLQPQTADALVRALRRLSSDTRVLIRSAGIDVKIQLELFVDQCVLGPQVRAALERMLPVSSFAHIVNYTCDTQAGEQYVCRPFDPPHQLPQVVSREQLLQFLLPYLDSNLCPHTRGMAIDVWTEGEVKDVVPHGVRELVRVMTDEGFCLEAGVALSPDHQFNGHFEFEQPPIGLVGCVLADEVGVKIDQFGKRLVVTRVRKPSEPQAESQTVEGAFRARQPSASSIHGPLTAKETVLEHYRRGNQLVLAQKYEAALDEYRKALAIDPTFAVAHRGIGVTYASMRRPQKALTAYKRYLELAPNAVDAQQVRKIIRGFENEQDALPVRPATGIQGENR